MTAPAALSRRRQEPLLAARRLVPLRRRLAFPLPRARRASSLEAGAQGDRSEARRPGRLWRGDRLKITKSLATIATVLALSTACGQARAADDFRSFERCVDEEAKKLVDHCAAEDAEKVVDHDHCAAGVGDPSINVALYSQVLATCRPGEPPKAWFDLVRSNNPYDLAVMGSVNVFVHEARVAEFRREAAEDEQRRRAQLAEDEERRQAQLTEQLNREHEREQRRKAAQAEENAAVDAYSACLFKHVQILAVVSEEPAATLAQAAVASCRAERTKVVEAFRSNSDLNPGLMDAVDERIAPDLMLEVIKARAAQRQAPPPAQTETKRRETPL